MRKPKTVMTFEAYSNWCRNRGVATLPEEWVTHDMAPGAPTIPVEQMEEECPVTVRSERNGYVLTPDSKRST